MRSAVTLLLQHLRHLRWRVACATRVRRRPMVSVLWTSVRGTDAKLCAVRVHRRSTGIDALGDHPRHRMRYWCQCPGALAPMSGPGRACLNNMRCYHFASHPQARSGEEKKYVPTRPKKEEVCGGKGRIRWAGKCQLPEQKRQVHDTGKPSLTAEFNPTNPLEQGLGDRFF